MKTVLTILFLVLAFYKAGAQNRSGTRWILGAARGVEFIFSDTSLPIAHIKYADLNAAFPYYYTAGHSNICDSASGKLLFSTTGMLIHDTTGAIMQNGDSLVESQVYNYNFYPNAPTTQGSLILPKGSNTGLYYLFIPTISDSAWNYYYPQGIKLPYDRLLVNVIDMNANGGLGSVVVKKKPLLQGVAIHKTMMQACRHSNGVDWWLLKQGEYDTNRIYRFLVKADTIEGPWIQSFSEPKYPSRDLSGQYAFSADGKKFVSVQSEGKMNKLFLADFDRCTGELSNHQIINIPIDSTTYPAADNFGNLDSINSGVCFSPNGQFIYVSKRYNIYQYEHQEPDSNLAWFRVQHGSDTSQTQFQHYGHLAKGPDNRIYIGYVDGTARQWSLINNPDNKGVNCNFCRKCMRLDTAVIFAFVAPPNMPDYTLGAEPGPCWPLSITPNTNESMDRLEVYPNPTSTLFYIKTNSKEERLLYNSVGQQLYSTYKNEIDVRGYCPGIYYIKVGSGIRKVAIE